MAITSENKYKPRVPLKSGIIEYDLTSGNIVQTEDEALCDTIILSGTIATARTVTLYLDADDNGAKNYKVVCKVIGGYNITISAGGSITSVLRGLIPTVETSIQSYYTTDVVVDASGNAYCENWAIRGSNSNGSYIKSGDGTLICFGSHSAAVSGAYYVAHAITLPEQYYDASAYYALAVCTQSVGGGAWFPYKINMLTGSSMSISTIDWGSGVRTGTDIIYWMTIGRWKA